MQEGGSIFRISVNWTAKNLAILTTVLLFTAAPALAGRYELVKTDIPDEGYQYSDVPGGVCEAYEKNLNSFSNEPYGMACGRKLNPALGFTRPTWEKLDLVKHAALAQEIEIFLKFPPFFGERVDAEHFLAALQEQQAKGLTLELARLDIDEDARPDNLIRFGWEGGCDAGNSSMFTTPPHRYLLVADVTLAKVDPRSRFIGAKEDVVLYQGRVYSDLFYGHPEGRKKYLGNLYLFRFGRHGAGDICRFHYHDPNLIFATNKNK